MGRTQYLDDYLETLPQGLTSYPSCQVKGNVLDETLVWLAEVESGPAPELREALSRACPLGRAMEWVPEVLVNAVSLQVADVGYPNGEAWLNAVCRRQGKAYRTPLYKALMLVLSPTLLMMGASERWRAYRRGTDLSVDRWHTEGEQRVTIGTIHHPPGLYAELNVLSLGQAFVAAVDASGARDVGLELLSVAAGKARFRLTYAA